MNIKSILAKPFAKLITERIYKESNNAVKVQQKVFIKLIGQAQHTVFGKDHNFSSINSYEDFKQLTRTDLINTTNTLIPIEIDDILKNNMCTPYQLCKCHYSYPYLTQSNDGVIHLLYTWHQSAIKHVYFSESSLLKLSQESGSPKS